MEIHLANYYFWNVIIYGNQMILNTVDILLPYFLPILKVDIFFPKSKKGNEFWTFLKCPFLKT